jgi:hypothetical protein
MGAENWARERTNPELKLARYRETGICDQIPIAIETVGVAWIVVMLVVWISTVLHISGVLEEIVGGGQEPAVSIAPAHVKNHSNDYNNRTGESSEPKNKPRKGFIVQEGISLGRRCSSRGRSSGGECLGNDKSPV